jgi:TonB family protein
VSSAVNTTTPDTGSTSKAANPLTRPSPVALEVPVSVTGTRADKAATRELFTEETDTVLLFRDGAVIRLSASVSAGQLLFLTDKRSNAEVVCQVLYARPCNESASYVDLQFTEDKPTFWDVAFPSSAKAAPEFSVKEHVEAEAMTSGDNAKPVEPHKPEEVDQLRKEVEALRKQLFELETKKSAEPAANAEPAPSAIREAPAPLARPEIVPAHEQVAVTPSPSTAPDPYVPLMPAAKDQEKKEAGRAVVSMSLPIRTTAEHQNNKGPNDTVDELLLPKPALDFTQMPPVVPTPPPLGLLRRPVTFDLRIWGLPIVVTLLVAGLVVGVWWFKPWRYLGPRQTADVMAASAARALPAAPKAAAAQGAARMGTEKAAANGGTAKSATESDPATVGEALSAENSADARAATSEARAAEQSTKKSAVKPRTIASLLPTPVADATEASPADATVVPAKLLKAANPVYPPEAMENFITGDVRAEAVVEPDGHVGEVQILSGPKPLRDAAIEALKRYQYSPATQGGKPVRSKVAAVVKFWFDP